MDLDWARRRVCAAVMLFAVGSLSAAGVPRVVEALDRGAVSVPGERGVLVSWRLLGTDRPDDAFNVYRIAAEGRGREAAVRLNAEPISGATCWLDEGAAGGGRYEVARVRDGAEGQRERARAIGTDAGRAYLSIPVRTPEGYAPNDGSVGDLDGDGVYEIVLHQVGRAQDNSRSGVTDPSILQAYRLDGEMLWEINLGRNIRAGAHYTQFLVYDFDGDGDAEVVCKTADGTVDGVGTVIGDADADHRNDRGYVLRGPEFLTIFDGTTGAAIDTADYVPPRHPETTDPSSDQLKSIWGDGYGNRSDRFLACVAFLEPTRPSIVMCRGYYTRSVLAAWDFQRGTLRQRWVFDSSDRRWRGRGFDGQGNHSVSVADVDFDGRDEIIYGGMTIDHNGRGMYTTRLGHGDALHVSDLDPDRPGLEVFRIQERFDDAGVHLFDARRGRVLWKHPSVARGRDGEGPGRGLSMDIDPRFAGAECWASGAGLNDLFTARGERVAELIGVDRQIDVGSCNMGVWWDGDPLRELLDGTRIMKWEYESLRRRVMLDAAEAGCASNNGTKANPVLCADLFGDWREEVIWRTADNTELRIFSTPIPTDLRLPTLMHDPQYRLAIAWQNVAYNQPAHPSYFIGAGMEKPAWPEVVAAGERGGGQR